MPRIEVFDRVQVLEKVRDLFWSKGFNGTSMQDLVDVTGLNRSSIYNSFGNKKALYEMVLKQYQKDSTAFFNEIIEGSKDAFDSLTIIFKSLIQSINKDEGGKGCFMINCTTELSQTDADLKLFLERKSEGMIQFFENLVIKGQTEGSINTEQNAHDYALYLYSSFQGLRITGILIQDDKRLDLVVKNTLETLK